MKGLNEIFETVRTHLLSQQAVSEDNFGSCRLRGRNGCRCAIGVLISDEHYDGGLEGLGISYYKAGEDGPLLHALALSGVDVSRSEVAALLQDLEDLHDAGHVAGWPVQLAEVARRHLDRATDSAATSEFLTVTV